MHSQMEVDYSKRHKSDINKCYNQSKYAVDIFDQLSQASNVIRQSRRWPMVFFMSLVNTALVNSYGIYLSNSKNNSNLMDRTDFNLSLARALTEGWKRVRLNTIPRMSSSLKRSIYTSLGEEEPKEETEKDDRSIRKRCKSCPTKESARNKTTTTCNKCKEYVCRTCLVPICKQRSNRNFLTFSGQERSEAFKQ